MFITTIINNYIIISTSFVRKLNTDFTVFNNFSIITSHESNSNETSSVFINSNINNIYSSISINSSIQFNNTEYSIVSTTVIIITGIKNNKYSVVTNIQASYIPDSTTSIIKHHLCFFITDNNSNITPRNISCNINSSIITISNIFYSNVYCCVSTNFKCSIS